MSDKITNILKLSPDGPVSGPQATAEVVAWLRDTADELERGETWPAQKAVLTIYQDIGQQFRTSTSFCNATPLERIAIMHLALHDATFCDEE